MFDIRRFGLFLRFELLSRRTNQLLPLVVPPALCMLGILFELASGRNVTGWPTTSFVIALILGVIASGLAHRPDLDAGTAPFHVLLPVSHLERFLARLATSLAVPFFGQLVLLTVLVNLFAGVGLLLGRDYPGAILPDPDTVLAYLGGYLTIHSTFFVGGIFFRSSPIIKTALAIIAYGIVSAIIGAIFTLGSMPEMTAFTFHFGEDFAGAAQGLETAGVYARISWQVLFPALMYVAAFYRIKENEVRG